MDSKEYIRRVAPTWSSCEVVGSSRYLGFVEGPNKGQQSWTKAIDKYKERSRLWNIRTLGLHLSAKTYNTFAVTVLSFLWQLEDIPESLYATEEDILMKAAPGPCKWASVEDLHFLKEHWKHIPQKCYEYHCAGVGETKALISGGSA